MKKAICYIEDKVPVSWKKETGLITKEDLAYALEEEVWAEPEVQEVISDIISTNEWDINVFTNPEFYFTYTHDNIFLPEVILFDWDYGIPGFDSEDQLLQLLKTSYALFFVYTNADTNEEVSEKLADTKFEPYRSRLEIQKKGESHSAKLILTKIQEKYKKGFSFQFSRLLYHNAIKALNELFLEISDLSIDEFASSFCIKRNDQSILHYNEFIEFILGRFQHKMSLQQFENLIFPRSDTIIAENLSKIWSYRLYYKSSDDNVKQGDIIQNINTGELFLVLSSDCHLLDFRKKLFSHIVIIPMVKLDLADNQFLTLWNDRLKDLNKYKVTSFVNIVPNGMPPILPFVPDNDESSFNKLLHDYILMPKLVNSIKIKNEEDSTAKELTYSYWKVYKKIVSISESFRRPIIQYLVDNISGYGCPDFSEGVQQLIKTNCKALKG